MKNSIKPSELQEKFDEYRKFVSEATPFDEDDWVARVAGLGEEVGEYFDKVISKAMGDTTIKDSAILKEAGDVFFSIADLFNLLEVPTPLVPTQIDPEEEINNLEWMVEAFSIIKKDARGDFSEEARRQRILALNYSVYDFFATSRNSLSILKKSKKKMLKRMAENTTKGDGDDR